LIQYLQKEGQNPFTASVGSAIKGEGEWILACPGLNQPEAHEALYEGLWSQFSLTNGRNYPTISNEAIEQAKEVLDWLQARGIYDYTYDSKKGFISISLSFIE